VLNQAPKNEDKSCLVKHYNMNIYGGVEV